MGNNTLIHELRDKSKYKYGMVVMTSDIPKVLIEWDEYPVLKVTPLTTHDDALIPYTLYKSDVTVEDVHAFLATRVIPKNRVDKDEICKWYGVPDIMPLAMCKKSYGRKMEDDLWIKFDGMENLVWDNVSLRKILMGDK